MSGLTIWQAVGRAYVDLPPAAQPKDWNTLGADADPEEAAMAAFRLAMECGQLQNLLLGVLAQGSNLRDDVRQQLRAQFTAELLPGAVNETQAMLDGSSLADFELIVPALMRTGRACAQITVDGRGSGTGFLVTDDLVMTAAHVVAGLVDEATGLARPGSGGRIAVRFPKPPETPQGWPTAPLDAAPDWLAFWHAPVTPVDGAPTTDRLDCVLIRLDDAVPAVVPRLDVRNPPQSAGTKHVQVIGFKGGNGSLAFDGASKLDDRPDGRVRHNAAAVAGISGGPYLDWKGQVFGLHEGTYGTPQPQHNRGVSLFDIRTAMRARPADPLLPAVRKPLWWLESAEARAAWAGAAGVAWDGRDRFHPVFGRQAWQDWIDEAARGSPGVPPLALVTGAAGSGKSFSAAILRARLAGDGDAVVSLPPERLRAADYATLLAQIGLDASPLVGLLPPVSFGTRPAAGHRRLDLLEPFFATLGAVAATGPARRIWITADLGGPDTWRLPGVAEFWTDLLKLALAQRRWLRIVLIGLDADDAIALQAQVAPNQVLHDDLGTLRWTGIWPVLRLAARDLACLDEEALSAAWKTAVDAAPERRLVESVRLVMSLR